MANAFLASGTAMVNEIVLTVKTNLVNPRPPFVLRIPFICFNNYVASVMAGNVLLIAQLIAKILLKNIVLKYKYYS